MSLIHNERTKLTATFLNGLAVAIIAIGGFAPFVNGAWGWTKGGICLAAGYGLHLLARAVLKGLQP